MASCLGVVPVQKDVGISFVDSNSLVLTTLSATYGVSSVHFNSRNAKNRSVAVSCSSIKLVRSPALDKHVVKQNRIRFVQKLKTLLLSKPKYYMPLHILSKCRSYLSLSRPQSILKMIHRYPTIFELFTIPIPPLPKNATKPYSQLCVRLTPAAAALTAQESDVKRHMTITLVEKLQKLLMLSSHRRLLLSKLVHLAPDLGLPVNFRSRLCNAFPDKFKTVDTSYGRALELVSWDPNLSSPLPSPVIHSPGLIVDRPLKFKHLKLRRGLNLKRRHRDFLIRFGELPDVCPYKTSVEELAKESTEAEKRACAVVREVLGMTVEKRTLIDHLTHLRKDFGLSNKLRAMLLRHPELFYVSLKGHRDSVFLVEAYDDKGVLLMKEQVLVVKEKFMELVREGKRIRQERRKSLSTSFDLNENNELDVYASDDDDDEDMFEDNGDGFEGLFAYEDFDVNDDDDVENNKSSAYTGLRVEEKFWTFDPSSNVNYNSGGFSDPW